MSQQPTAAVRAAETRIAVAAGLIQGAYVSGDELERAEAYELGYRDVCSHSRQIGVLEPSEILVIDLGHVLLEERDIAIVKANETANRGVLVGIHTYYPDDPRLDRFLALPNVLVAQTHARVIAALRRWALIHPYHPAAAAAWSFPVTPKEVSHVGECSHDDAGPATGDPAVPLAGS